MRACCCFFAGNATESRAVRVYGQVRRTMFRSPRGSSRCWKGHTYLCYSMQQCSRGVYGKPQGGGRRGRGRRNKERPTNIYDTARRSQRSLETTACSTRHDVQLGPPPSPRNLAALCMWLCCVLPQSTMTIPPTVPPLVACVGASMGAAAVTHAHNSNGNQHF